MKPKTYNLIAALSQEYEDHKFSEFSQMSMQLLQTKIIKYLPPFKDEKEPNKLDQAQRPAGLIKLTGFSTGLKLIVGKVDTHDWSIDKP